MSLLGFFRRRPAPEPTLEQAARILARGDRGLIHDTARKLRDELGLPPHKGLVQ